MPQWVVANEIIEKLGRAPSKVEKGFIISISLESINIDYVYKKVSASIKGVDMGVDLILLESHDFDGYSLSTVWQKRNI
jgi:hypothetical protein